MRAGTRFYSWTGNRQKALTVMLPLHPHSSQVQPIAFRPSFAATRRPLCLATFNKTNCHGYRPIPLPVTLLRLSKHQLIECNGSNTSEEFSPGINETTGALFRLCGEIGVSEDVIEFILERNSIAESSSLESVRSRIHSLQSVGLGPLVLSKLISRRPDILTAPQVGYLINFIHDDLDNEIEPVQIQRLLIGTEPSFFTGFDTKVRLLLEQGIPQEKIAHVLNHVNLTKAICLKSTEDIHRTISIFNRYGGLSIIVRLPRILNYDLDNQLIPRIGFIRQLSGGDEVATGEVLNRLPAILSYSVDHMEDHVEFLKSFAGLSEEEVFRIVHVFPNVISASKERKLRPRIDFLKQCRLDSDDIFRFLIKAPLFLGLSFEENLAYKLGLLVKIGYAYRTRDLAMAMGAVTRTSYQNLQRVIGMFLSYGFSFEDILVMSNKHPQILQYNPNSLEEKMEYLVEEMGREVGELLSFPAFLGYDLDKRIKHRYESKKKTFGGEMSINKLLSVSAERFSRVKEGSLQSQKMDSADIEDKLAI